MKGIFFIITPAAGKLIKPVAVQMQLTQIINRTKLLSRKAASSAFTSSPLLPWQFQMLLQYYTLNQQLCSLHILFLMKHDKLASMHPYWPHINTNQQHNLPPGEQHFLLSPLPLCSLDKVNCYEIIKLLQLLLLLFMIVQDVNCSAFGHTLRWPHLPLPHLTNTNLQLKYLPQTQWNGEGTSHHLHTTPIIFPLLVLSSG